MKGHFAFYAYEMCPSGVMKGHSIDNRTITAKCWCPVGRWIWLKQNLIGYVLMGPAAQLQCTRRHAEHLVALSQAEPCRSSKHD